MSEVESVIVVCSECSNPFKKGGGTYGLMCPHCHSGQVDRTATILELSNEVSALRQELNDTENSLETALEELQRARDLRVAQAPPTDFARIEEAHGLWEIASARMAGI